MKKKIFVRKLISLGIASVGIGSVALPVGAASPVLASETVVTQEDLDAKKAELDKAQAEYDEALKEQQAARDVVVNAERARDDAEEKYEYALERYPKGLAGFLQWVSETGSRDTEEEEFKVVEAQQTLADLKLSGYDDYYGDQVAGLFEFYDIADNNIGASSSPTNLTRMYYSLDWMEEVAKYVSSGKLSNVRTSHGAMASAMDHATFLSSDIAYDDYFGTVGKVVDFSDWEVEDLNEFYGGAHFYYMLLNDKGADISEVSEDGIPQMEHYTGKFPDRLTDFTVTYMEAIDYDEERDEPILGSEEITTENPVMGFALGTSKRGDFVVWTVAEEYYSNYLPTYTLDEYMQALRDYFSISDPETTNLALINTDNDLNEAQRELTLAEEFLSVRAGRLKDAQREYEEAVAEFEAMPAEDTSEVLPEGDYIQAEQEGVTVIPIVQEEEAPVTPIVHEEEVTVTPIVQEEEELVMPIVQEEEVTVTPIVQEEEAPVTLIVHEEEVTVTPIVQEEEAPVTPIVHEEEVTVTPIVQEDEVPVMPIVQKEEAPVAPIVQEEEVTVTPIVHEEEVTVTPVVHEEEMTATPIVHEGETAVMPVVQEEAASTGENDKGIINTQVIRTPEAEAAGIANALSETPQAQRIQGIEYTQETEIPASYVVAYSEADETKSISEAVTVVGAEAANFSPEFVQESAVNSETVIKAENTVSSNEKEEKKEDSILAEVLSYIFNGGAIAFIIPAGFIRRKSDKELLV